MVERCKLDYDRVPPTVEVHNNKASRTYEVHYREQIAIEDYDGVVINYAATAEPDLRVVCTARRADGQLCGSIIKNNQKNLRSHRSDMHKTGSKYELKQDKERVFRCDACRRLVSGLNCFLGHSKRCGKFKGTYAELFQHEIKFPMGCSPPKEEESRRTENGIDDGSLSEL